MHDAWHCAPTFAPFPIGMSLQRHRFVPADVFVFESNRWNEDYLLLYFLKTMWETKLICLSDQLFSVFLACAAFVAISTFFTDSFHFSLCQRDLCSDSSRRIVNESRVVYQALQLWSRTGLHSCIMRLVFFSYAWIDDQLLLYFLKKMWETKLICLSDQPFAFCLPMYDASLSISRFNLVLFLSHDLLPIFHRYGPTGVICPSSDSPLTLRVVSL